MKRPTQADVARRAGVSRATVSHVVNRRTGDDVRISAETRQRVLDVVAELGYLPDARAVALRSGNTRTIGAIIPDIRNPHFWEYADGIEKEAHARGYRILISSTSPSPEHESDTLKDLTQRRIDGLILQGSFPLEYSEVNKTLSRLIKRQLPIVKIGEPADNIDSVWSDYRSVTVEVMEYLIGLGHQRIGLIYGVAAYVSAQDRLEPYKDCLRNAGLPVDDALIAHCGPTIEDAYQAATQLLQMRQRPTAIVAINDMLAFGVLRAAGDLGLSIPDALSVISYDDIPMAKYLNPRLTTVSKDAVKFGKESVRLLLARIEDPNRPIERVNMPIRLIKRESTGPAPTL